MLQSFKWGALPVVGLGAWYYYRAQPKSVSVSSFYNDTYVYANKVRCFYQTHPQFQDSPTHDFVQQVKYPKDLNKGTILMINAGRKKGVPFCTNRYGFMHDPSQDYCITLDENEESDPHFLRGIPDYNTVLSQFPNHFFADVYLFNVDKAQNLLENEILVGHLYRTLRPEGELFVEEPLISPKPSEKKLNVFFPTGFSSPTSTSVLFIGDTESYKNEFNRFVRTNMKRFFKL
jgi:hypothetical protein